MTDFFRALCAELVDAFKDENTYTIRIELIDRVRAALAEQPVGPTDEELDEFVVFWWGTDTDYPTVTDVIECGSMAAFARAVLARFGTQK
jgi:hypothetical protein